MNGEEKKLAHLAWTVSSRHANQVCSLKLLTLFSKHENIWKTKYYARAAQDLTAVAFSLWRAAFLADKTGQREAVFNDGKKFLERVIEDNAISYPQDKLSREWTFNYYTRNARAALQILHENWEEAVPAYEGQKRNATERWEYCQSLLDNAVNGFEKLLDEKAAEAKRIKSRNKARAERKERRGKVRRLTLGRRNQSEVGKAA